MAKPKSKSKPKMTMAEFERSAKDRKADRVELAKINKRRPAR